LIMVKGLESLGRGFSKSLAPPENCDRDAKP
jgi:hypothetical protein